MNTLSFSYNGYNAAAVAAPGGWGLEERSPTPEHKCFRAAKMRIDSRKNFKFSLNFSKFLLKFS